MAITNTYDQNIADGGDRIVIFFSPQTTGRACRSAKYQIGHFKNGKSFVTDKKAAWYDNQRKSFHVGITPKEQAFQEAVAWANEQYGKRDFVRNRIGDYVEREVNDKFPLPKREYKKRKETGQNV